MLKEETRTFLKFNSEGLDQQDIFNDAKKSAVEAVDKFMNTWREKTGGNEYDEPMYCGFANVKIYPARGKFIKFLKGIGIGDNGYKGGWRISYYDIMPLDHPKRSTQSMDIKEEACDAFADALEKYGIKSYMESRAD